MDRGFGAPFSAHAGVRLRNRGTSTEAAPHGLRGGVRTRQRSAIMPMGDAKNRETEDFAAHGDGVDGAVVDFCVRGVGRGWRDWHTGRQTGRGRAGGGRSMAVGRISIRKEWREERKCNVALGVAPWVAHLFSAFPVSILHRGAVRLRISSQPRINAERWPSAVQRRSGAPDRVSKKLLRKNLLNNCWNAIKIP